MNAFIQGVKIVLWWLHSILRLSSPSCCDYLENELESRSLNPSLPLNSLSLLPTSFPICSSAFQTFEIYLFKILQSFCMDILCNVTMSSLNSWEADVPFRICLIHGFAKIIHKEWHCPISEPAPLGPLRPPYLFQTPDTYHVNRFSITCWFTRDT